MSMKKTRVSPATCELHHHHPHNRKRVEVLQATEIVKIDDDDDSDLTLIDGNNFCSRQGTNKSNAIPVDHFHEGRNLHLALMASLTSSNPTAGSGTTNSSSLSVCDSTSTLNHSRRQQKPLLVDLSREDNDIHDDDEVQVLPQKPIIFNSKIRNTRNNRPVSIIEIGEPSNSKSEEEPSDGTFMCQICVEPKTRFEMFFIMRCTHSYCSECMVKYVASRLQDNITQIRCPLASSGCQGLLEPENCRSILPAEVFDRWGSALCEAVILASEKFYCPFKDCSALLIMDDQQNDLSFTQSECPNCWRLFCMQCKVPWHSGIECGEFQKLNKDEREREDLLLMQLAKNNRWIRCSKCRFYVEKSQGCLFMKCRCGYTFCYNCGAPMKDHYCTNCKH